MGKHSEQFIEEREAQDADEQAAYQHQMEEAEYQAASFQPLNFFQRGLTKSQVKEMACTAIENVLLNGNPLEVAEALSAMECFIKEVKDDKRFKEYVREEAVKTPRGFVSKSGAKIEICETGTAYDYSQCNDYLLDQYEQELATAKENLESRKTFLKAVPTCGLDIVTPDAELVRVYPPSKSSTSSYKVTLSR